MKLRRILLLMMVFVIAGAGTAFANSVFDYLRAKKVDVTVNGESVAVNGHQVQIDRKNVPMADVQSMLNELGGYMRVDEKTGKIDIYKPNVQLVLMWSDTRARDQFLFSHTVKKDRALNIRLIATVDSVLEDIETVRFSILDPSDTVVLEVEDDKSVSTLKNNITHIRNDFQYTFDKAGLYTVQFSVKPRGSDQFFQVGQSVFESTE